MKHIAILGDTQFPIEDTKFFHHQSKSFREAFDKLREGDIAEFDNCTVTLISTGRVIITMKEE